MRRVLVLRPEPGAGETVRKARERGLEPIALPLFEVHSSPWTVPDPSGFDGLLLTSANAIRHGGEQLKRLRGLKVYAVGEATGEAARGAGFDVAATGDSGVDRLLGSVEPNLRLLHLCAADRREPDSPRQTITALPVYESSELAGLDLSMATGSLVLIHSPRAGRRFAELVDQRESIALAAISQAAADAAGQGWEQVSIAEQPNDDALLALATSLCNKPHPQ
jgi:uroporphyrinogen-III synthase